MTNARKHIPGGARGESADIGLPENPLDLIAEDHMREREVCALIDRLVADMPLNAGDLGRMISFLEDHLPHHLADEEEDLFPLMRDRCDPEDEIGVVIDRLLSDHGHAIADAPQIVDILRAIVADAAPIPEPDRQRMVAFAHQSRRHLILENAVILPIARVRLTVADLNTMKTHMLERRGLAPRRELT